MTRGHSERFRQRLCECDCWWVPRLDFDLAAVVEWSDVVEWSGAAALMSQSNRSACFRVESGCCCVFELSWCGTARVDVSIQLAGVVFCCLPSLGLFFFLI
jgi:hypothetical protein